MLSPHGQGNGSFSGPMSPSSSLPDGVNSNNANTNNNSNKSDCVHVYARFRPLSALELEKDARSCADYTSDRVVSISNPDEGTMHRFTFQQAYQPETTQQALYLAVGAPVVEDVLKGYNATIFAYGQTGSGKTYTMMGPPNTNGRGSAATPVRRQAVSNAAEEAGFDLHGPNSGVVPRAVHDLFARIKRAPVTTKFTVRVSYVEIYMERIRDLFEPTKTNLPLREDIANKRFYVDGCLTYDVTSAAEVLEYIDMGTRNRATAATKVNELSSRSHSIVTLEVTSTDEANDIVLMGRLHLVDLAGSEKVSKTHAAGVQLDEAKLINKSLTTLSLVISNLTDPKSMHVPYRDSKLTRLLQDSLGGNARTSLVVCCSPSLWNIAETMSTLRFGSWVTKVENHAVVNQELTPGELKALIAKLEEEVRQLRARPAGGAANISAEDAKSLEVLREDAQQLVLLQRQYQRQGAAIEALRETVNESTLREQIATQRADAAEAQLQLVEEECQVWEEEYNALARELASVNQTLDVELRNGQLLRSVVVQAHEAIEAAREELLQIATRLKEGHIPPALLQPAAKTTESGGVSPLTPDGRASQGREPPTTPFEKQASNVLDYSERLAHIGTQMAAALMVSSSVQTEEETLPPSRSNTEPMKEEKPLQLPPSAPAANAESAAPTPPFRSPMPRASTPTPLSRHSDSDVDSAVGWAEHDAMCRRATLAEQQLRALQDQWRELVSETTATKLELEFNTKKLQIRNERIENLKAALHKEKDESNRLREARDLEKKSAQNALTAANAQIQALRQEVESLRGIVGQMKHARNNIPNFVGDPAADFLTSPPGSAPSPGRMFGGHFARQLRGTTPNGGISSSVRTPTSGDRRHDDTVVAPLPQPRFADDSSPHTEQF